MPNLLQLPKEYMLHIIELEGLPSLRTSPNFANSLKSLWLQTRVTNLSLGNLEPPILWGQRKEFSAGHYLVIMIYH